MLVCLSSNSATDRLSSLSIRAIIHIVQQYFFFFLPPKSKFFIRQRLTEKEAHLEVRRDLLNSFRRLPKKSSAGFAHSRYELFQVWHTKLFWRRGTLQYLHPIAHSINVWGSVLTISNTNTKDRIHIVMSTPLWKHHDHRQHYSLKYIWTKIDLTGHTPNIFARWPMLPLHANNSDESIVSIPSSHVDRTI